MPGCAGCPRHPRWGHFPYVLASPYRRALQARAPCTRSRWALPPAPPLGPFSLRPSLPVSTGSAGACALHPQPPTGCPRHPRWGHFPYVLAYPYLRTMQALAPCTRSRWAPPPAPPLGPFHFPRPLEVQAFCSAELLPLMPPPRYSGAGATPYQDPKAFRVALLGHELTDRYSHQK
jgi:hypothetical protein